MAVSKRKRVSIGPRTTVDEDPPLSAAQRRADERHLKDTEDRTRYLLVSLTVPGLSLYYRVEEDAWSFDDPTEATLFKRRIAARAVKDLLRPGVHIVPCKVDEDGALVLSSLAAHRVRGRPLATVPSWRRKRKAGRGRASARAAQHVP
jgi:hypothetical protein